MLTYIDISDLRVIAPIGVMARERLIGNEFLISIRLYYDAAEAMRSDNITSAINYAEVVDVVKNVLSAETMLIEHAAARILEAIKKYFPKVTSGKLSICKVHPPISAPTPRVSFSIEW